jgi:geranylgeranyl diphosphate synthase type II
MQLPAAIAQRCAIELSRATGVAGMTGGQSMDMRGLGAKAGIQDVQLLHSRKTGALIVACVRMGAMVAAASDDKLQALTRYAEGIGVAFQITDDLLDVTASSAALGKTAGKDVAQGKVTYPSLLGIEGSKAAAKVAVNDAVNALLPFGKKAEHLVDLAGYILARKK